MTKSVAFLVALLLPAIATAQNTVAFRVGPGLQLSCDVAAPTHVATRGTVWCKSSDSNKLHYTDPSGADVAIGAAGGSTGNWSFSGNNSDLSAAGTMGVCTGATATACTIGKTNAPATLNSTLVSLRSGTSDGSTAVAAAVDTTTTWANASARLLSLRNNTTERIGFKLNEMVFPANFNFTSSSAAATNTTSLALLPNVADGATSVALKINAQTALANATAKLVSIQNAGTELLSFRLNSTDGVKLVDGGGTSTLALSTVTGAAMSYGGAIMSVGLGSASMGDGTGSLALNAGNLVLTIFQGTPDADGTRDWGTVGARWRVLASKRHPRGSQSMAHSTTPAFDCTAGNFIHVGPVTANITGPTMVAGSAGETCTIVFLKDATGGTFTIAGWGTNTRAAGTLTFTSGASSLVTITFVWDDRLSTPAWVETNRTAFN